MQKWSLQDKVAHANDMMAEFIYKIGGLDKVYISFSGGVDSLVLLYLARNYISPKTKAAFCNTGMEWPEMVEFVKTFDNVDIITPKMHAKKIYAEKGFPLVSKQNSYYIREARRPNKDTATYKLRMGDDRFFSIPKKWKFLVTKPYSTSEQCCEYLKKKPMKEYEKETGRKPILGIMAAESLLRTQNYVRYGGCNSFATKREHSWPMSIWTSEDVWQFIRENNIEYCKIYDELKDKRTGCICCGYGVTLDPHKLDLLYSKYPKLYRHILSWENNGVPFRTALRDTGMILPDEKGGEQ